MSLTRATQDQLPIVLQTAVSARVEATASTTPLPLHAHQHRACTDAAEYKPQSGRQCYEKWHIILDGEIVHCLTAGPSGVCCVTRKRCGEEDLKRQGCVPHDSSYITQSASAAELLSSSQEKLISLLKPSLHSTAMECR